MHGVLDQVLLLLDLDLGGAADPDHRHAAGQLGHPLLQLLAVVVGCRLLDQPADLVAAALDVRLLAGAVDDGHLLLGDDHLLGAAQHVEGDVLELDAQILADHLAGGENRHVLEHRLAPIAEARRLDRRDLEAASQFVDHQRGQGLALDVLGHHQERPPRFDHRLQNRQHRLQAGELFLVQQDVRILELAGHFLGVGDEVGREIAAVGLHALHHLELDLEALGLLDRDHALLPDLLHGLGDHVADLVSAISRDGADLGDLLAGGDGLGVLLEVFDDGVDGHVDAAFQVHRVHARGHRLGALAHDRLGQHRRRGGAVAGGIRGLVGNITHHLGAHVLELVDKLDLLGHRHPVLGNARRPVGLVENHIAPLGTERDLDRLGQDVDALQQPLAGLGAELDFFRSHRSSLPIL